MRLAEVWKPWTGHWITDAGDIHDIDHGEADVHHAQVALDHFPPEPEEEDPDDDGGDAAIVAALYSGWIRTSMRDTEMAIQFYPRDVTRTALEVLRDIVRDEPEWSNYYLNDEHILRKADVLRRIGQAIQAAPRN